MTRTGFARATLDGPLDNARAGQAWKRFWLKWRRFDDRASVSEFVWALLPLLLIGLPVMLVYSVVLVGVNEGTISEPGVLIVPATLAWSFSLAIVVPWLALVVRRLRDAGIPTIAVLLALIPGAHIVLLIFLLRSSRDDLSPRGEAASHTLNSARPAESARRP